MGPRDSLDDVQRRKSYPYRVSNSDPSVVQWTALSRLSTTIVIYQIKCRVICMGK
jgi:hypothetical protein